MNKIISKLKQNSTIAFIAPAGFISERKNIDKARVFLEKQGFRVVYGKHLFGKDKYLSGTDEERLADLHWAFSDDSIDAIICARGGYGCLRLVDKIDYELIRNNPKFFCGYSDITILSAMFLKRAGLVTYSGPMANSDFGDEYFSEYTKQFFFNTVVDDNAVFAIARDTYNYKDASGIFWGGNLASIVSLCGVDFIPDEDFIFFTEDLNEPVYKIDKMFTQLTHLDKFKKNVKGILIGDFLYCSYPEQLNELYKELADKLDVPVLTGFKITHGKDKMTIPYGLKGTIRNEGIMF